MLRGYFDESGKQDDPQHKCISFGGYLASLKAWSQFEMDWREALDAFGVPYFHMREFNKKKGVFSHFTSEQKTEFLKRLICVIKSCSFHGFGALIRLPDLEQFNAEHGLHVDAYALAVYSTLLDISEKFAGTPIEIWVDHFDHSSAKLREAHHYILTDAYYPQYSENFQTYIRLSAMPKQQTFRQVLPLQAADFAAWELRKLHVQNNEWFETVKPTIDDRPEEWLGSLLQWQLQRDRKIELPFNARKSFRALSNAAHFEGTMWDLRTLRIAHKGRKGLWFPFAEV